MAISYRGNTANTVGAASVAVAVPAGTAAGDLLITLGWSNVSSVGLLTAPVNWFEVPRFGRATANINYAQAWYHIQSSTDPTSYTFNASGGTATAFAMDAYIGVDVQSPLDGVTPSSISGGAVTVTYPSITTLTDSAWHICLLVDDNTHPETAPTNYTTRISIVTGTEGTYSRVISPAGLVSGVSANTGSSWVAGSIALMPLLIPAAQDMGTVNDSALPEQGFAARQPEGLWV